jgi:hypothetical protein
MNWKPVVGWSRYEVSDSGELRNVTGGRRVGQWLSDQGYALARLSGPRRMVRVHRLVAEAFIPNPLKAQTVNHRNNDRSDNRVENLEWCSQQENLAHAARQGRMRHDYWLGKRSPSAKLTDAQVFEIRQLYGVGNTSWADLSRRFGVCKRTIGRCLNREAYADV